MTKENGLGATVSIDDSAGSAKAIGNDITNFEIATPKAVQDVTGVNKSAIERLHLLADAAFSPTGVFNDAADFSHAVLKTIPSTSVARTVTVAHSGQTLAGEYLGTDYQLTRGATGELTWQAPFVLADGTTPTWS